MPKRIQLKRTKGWRMPPNTVKVTRPGCFGNPFKGPKAASLYRRWMTGKLSRAQWEALEHAPLWHWFDRDNVKLEMTRLRGKDLACWCALDEPCHADVLLELANPDREG